MAAMVTGVEGMFAGARTAGSAARTGGRALSIEERNRERFEAQRSNRRGAPLEVFFTKHIDNSRIVKADDPERRREMRQFTMVMSVLFCLCMVYVWQHFKAIEMGYKIEAQKTVVEQMREQNRQLRLTEAQLTEPARIDAIAKQLGLNTPAPGQVIRNDAVTGVSTGEPALADNRGPSFGWR